MVALTIAFFELDRAEQSTVQKKLAGHRVLFFSQPIQNVSLAKLATVNAISVFVRSKVDAKLITSLPQLRCIVTRSTGFDHINLAATKKRRITVCNVPSYGENTVAEHAFALLLTLARKIPDGANRTRRGVFEFSGLTGTDLKGKTLGIIGLGRIGKYAAKIGAGFGMNLLAYDVIKDQTFAKQHQVTFVNLSTLLKKSDVVTLHTFLSPKTRHLINAKTIRQMKAGAILLNTARGGLVDTAALLSALNSKHLAGAGLDVLEAEDVWIKRKSKQPLTPSDHTLESVTKKLLRHPRAIVTPHSAFDTVEARQRILATSLDNLQAWIKGKPINQIS